MKTDVYWMLSPRDQRLFTETELVTIRREALSAQKTEHLLVLSRRHNGRPYERTMFVTRVSAALGEKRIFKNEGFLVFGFRDIAGRHAAVDRARRILARDHSSAAKWARKNLDEAHHG